MNIGLYLSFKFWIKEHATDTTTTLSDLSESLFYKLKILFLFLFSTLSSILPSWGSDPCSPDQLNSLISLPPGFSIELYASQVQGARSMTQGPDRVIFVGSRREGKVYALRDSNNDHKVDDKIVISENLNSPNGVAYHQKLDTLYVAEIHRIIRIQDISKKLKSAFTRLSPTTSQLFTFDVLTEYPRDTHHGWKFIAFGPDQKLYVPVGAPCNICKSAKPIYASITRVDAQGKNREIVAHGIRNTVGFDWHPITKELWFTDNGRDWMGDHSPPDEINRAPKDNLHFGYPYCHGKDIADPQFGSERKCSDLTPATGLLGPHVAALGMRFYTGQMYPQKYRNQIFIAEHGSWNRSKKIGYRVSLVTLKDNTSVQDYGPFAHGWLTAEGKVCGRPVDVLVAHDGALLVSDDDKGRIYRISYKAP